jgi:5S rRNA maturation endonuclease (ribonuclease M5)
MRTDQAKRIPMGYLLEKLGVMPNHTKGRDVWYCSPFRQEAEASFKVNTEWNTWYDFGKGAGGNILDFTMQYYHTDLKGALHALDKIQGILATPLSPNPPLPSLAPKNPPKSGLQLVKLQPLQHQALVSYIEGRGIPFTLAREYVQEAYYAVDGKVQVYFAVAFPNDDGSFELRNAYFKGVLGQKAISVVHRQENADIFVFEGFFDFLSWQVHQKPASDSTVIVLNSVAMKEKAIAAIRDLHAPRVYTFFDHDESGKRLTSYFTEQLPTVEVVDQSGVYAGFEDYNAFLQQQKHRERMLG